MDVDYCIALRAYALCVKRQARSCRGDLVYHSAVFPIKELFFKHNCSSDGPTSFAKAPSTPRPAASELCNYENRVLMSGSAAQQKKYAHCGLFGDPHLRTFRDEFQTCKVEGAWPLIDNRFLSVQVTNVPVVLGSSATATSKVTDISAPGVSLILELKCSPCLTHKAPPRCRAFLIESCGGAAIKRQTCEVNCHAVEPLRSPAFLVS